MRFLVLLLLVCSIWAVPVVQNHASTTAASSVVEWGDWDVVGPLASAPREGVDISAAFGGIEKMRASRTPIPSELAENGTAPWVRVTPGADGSVSLPFSDIARWSFLQQPFGSAAIQLQGFAISNITFVSPQPQNSTALVHMLFSCTVKAFWIDGKRYHGDTYGMGVGKAAVHLIPGTHVLSLWFTGAGGAGFSCSAQEQQQQEVVDGGVLLLGEGEDVMPDLVDGHLVSEWMGVSVINVHPTEPMSGIAAVITTTTTTTTTSSETQQQAQEEIGRGEFEGLIQPGQSVQIRIKVSQRSLASSGIIIHIVDEGKQHAKELASRAVNLASKKMHEPFTMTFLDVDRSVQYAAVIPPAQPCACKDGCAVLLTTHGAGVDAKSTAWTGAYRAQAQAWILLPTNRAPYGYDWQGPGLRNALAALSALSSPSSPPGIPSAQASLYRVDATRILYAGHSMGGHGCLILSTHYPDLALAAAPAAGWIKHQLYTPYYLRVSDAWADPQLKAVLESAIAEYDTDVYSQHLRGVPLVVRMGSNDDK